MSWVTLSLHPTYRRGDRTAGLASIKRGDVVDGEVVMARLEERLRKARESQG